MAKKTTKTHFMAGYKRLGYAKRPVEGYVLLPDGGKISFRVFAGSKTAAHRQMKGKFPKGKVYIETR